jgi:hypothetical protein
VQLLRVTCEAGIPDLIAGHAVLCITVGDHTDSDTRLYWLRANVAHTGHIVSFELTTFRTGERYELPADLSSCSCADGIYREDRPGGCKHAAALRKVLVGMSRGTPWPGFSSDDPVIEAVASDDDPAWDERWTIVEPGDSAMAG